MTPPPTRSHPLVRRLLDGIANDKAQRESARRRSKPSSAALTFDLVLRMRANHTLTAPSDAMRFAAVALAVAACLRPSELLGSASHPARALRADQLTFYADLECLRAVLPSDAAAAAPAHCAVTLEVSKTDQKRRGKVRLVAAPAAVQALWSWARLRSAPGTQRLFALNGQPLSQFALLSHVRKHLRLLGADLFVTGKCYRRGGASTLSMQGIAASDIAISGWAPNSRMWELYASDPRVQRARQLATNRAMQEDESAAAAAAASR